MNSHTHHAQHDAPAERTIPGHATVGGLSVAVDGLRLVPDRTRFRAGESVDWTFHVVDRRGAVHTAYESTHDQLAHLLVVRRDLTNFQHLHPTLDADGTWHVDGFTLPDPGVYRAFVDVVVGGQPTTLGVDLFVPGGMTVADRPADSRRTVVDGYEVELRGGVLRAGVPDELAFVVSRHGATVDRLDPYLGALGHLVALREGDLGYLHVHPVETRPDGGRIVFGATFPSAGNYRLFLQSKPDGRLLTTQHDVAVGDGGIEKAE